MIESYYINLVLNFHLGSVHKGNFAYLGHQLWFKNKGWSHVENNLWFKP